MSLNRDVDKINETFWKEPTVDVDKEKKIAEEKAEKDAKFMRDIYMQGR